MDENLIEQYKEEMMQMYRRRGSAGEPEQEETPVQEPNPVQEEDPAPESTSQPPLSAKPVNPPAEMTGRGKVIVMVTCAKGNCPIKDAVVTVRVAGDESGEALRGVTDRSGKTEPFTLPAPASRYSMAPAGRQVAVFALYDIQAEADNYVTNIIRNVPVFDGIVSIQTMQMLWVPVSDGKDCTESENMSNPYRL